ncbi:hypothetical protein PTKIN_Ptkin16aG0076900 [Pterospermum kingtungense]
MEGHNMCWSAIVGDNVLKGHENYANWNACLKNYLRSRDLWDVVEETTTSEPPKQVEISKDADLKAWEKRNASALHAIQISCAPTMLSYIRDKTTAKDAWYTLAQKSQPPPMSAQPEKDNVETEGLQMNDDLVMEKSWLVGKLFTDQPFNREALLSMFKIVRAGWCRNLQLRVEIDIVKPLRHFIAIPRGGGNEDIWARLKYERLPLFCYEGGKIGHEKYECEKVSNNEDEGGVK